MRSRDATPRPYMLEGLRAEKQDWSVLLAEALDNSFGADAKAVSIALSSEHVVITDDGHGINEGDEEGLYQLGAHLGEMHAFGIGRYGLGIKWQALNAGNLLEFSSISKDGSLTGFVDWAEMIRANSWHHGAYTGRSGAAVGKPTGTTIAIRRLRVKPPSLAKIQKATEEIARRYRPALALGRKIVVNGLDVLLTGDPELTDMVSGTITLPSGKGATVYGGLLKDTKNAAEYGVLVSKGFKVILDGRTNFGVGDYTAAQPRIFCRVDLIGDWELSRFKDAIIDADKDALDEAIEGVLRPILEKAESESFDVATNELADAIHDLLPSIAAARPKRTKEASDQTPAEERKHRSQGNPTKNPEPGKSGPAKAVTSNRLLRIEFLDGLFAKKGIGVYVQSASKRTPDVVRFAKDCPAIRDYMKRPKRGGAKPLCDIALGWYLYRKTQIIDDYGQQMWDLMGLQSADAIDIPAVA